MPRNRHGVAKGNEILRPVRICPPAHKGHVPG
jgi:hypothetical protein